MTTNRTITSDDSFWVRVFQAMHPGLCAMSLISGAPVCRSLAVVLEARGASVSQERR